MKNSRYNRSESREDIPRYLKGDDERRLRRLTRVAKPKAYQRQATYQRSTQAFAHRGIAKTLVRYQGKHGQPGWSGTKSPRAYGVYLERSSKKEMDDGQRQDGFNETRTDVHISDAGSQWNGDQKYFEIIISPGVKIDMPEHVREVMAAVEQDLGTKLEWVGVVHHDTDHTHAHVMVRGVDEQGKEIWLDPQYIAYGIPDRMNESIAREQAKEKGIER